MKKLGLFSLFLVLFITACRKDVDITTIEEETPDPGTIEYVEEVSLITGDISGIIYNENEAAIEGASVTLNGQTTTTNQYGLFIFNNVEMNALGELVTVEKDGYFEGSRRFFPQDGAKSQVQVQLINKVFSQSFEATTGGVIDLNGGGTVSFTGDGVVLDDGTAYEGLVQVASYWLDPTALRTGAEMPGNLQGVSLENEEVALATYGMVAVELATENGEHLQLAEGHAADLMMPVPEGLLANAPAEIPLWAFHEDIGMWVEESTASLQNGAYIGKVDHFSFWNCDAPFPLVEIDFTLINEAGLPVANRYLSMTSPNVYTGHGSSDNNGFVFGKVPAGEELTLEVRDVCNEIIATILLGTFTEDTSLGTLTVTGDNISETTITGTLVDCDGNAVQNGVVRAVINNNVYTNTYVYTINGEFTFSIYTCNSTTSVDIIGVDLDELLESLPVAATPNVANDLGEISVCGNDLENYIQVTVDGVTKVYTGATVDSFDTFTFVQAGDVEDANVFTGFSGITVGDYGSENGENGIFDQAMGWNVYPNTQVSYPNYNVTQYDTKVVGEVSGTAQNNIDPDNPVDVEVSIIFDVNL